MCGFAQLADSRTDILFGNACLFVEKQIGTPSARHVLAWFFLGQRTVRGLNLGETVIESTLAGRLNFCKKAFGQAEQLHTETRLHYCFNSFT